MEITNLLRVILRVSCIPCLHAFMSRIPVKSKTNVNAERRTNVCLSFSFSILQPSVTHSVRFIVLDLCTSGIYT